MEKRAITLLEALTMMAAATACRPSSGAAGGAKYPRRAPGCTLAVSHEVTPAGGGAWDDLGIAEVACHINTAYPQCFDRLRAEACRLGGDLLYNVPQKPLRP